MNGCFSKLALFAVQVCLQSGASLHAPFSKFAQRSAQTCAAMLPNLRFADSKLAFGVGHGGMGLPRQKEASFLVCFELRHNKGQQERHAKVYHGSAPNGAGN